MKRLIALVLLFGLLAFLSGCAHTPPSSIPTGSSTATTAPTTAPSTAPTETTRPTEPEDPWYKADYENNFVIGGEVAAFPAQGNTLEVSYNDPYKGTPGFDYASPHVYTFREYLPNGKNLNWSPLTWQTNEDAYILDYTTMGLYCFTLNSDLTGWTIVPEMAAAAPEDVTADYVGQFGITKGETAKAWRIALNPQAYFSNGQPIDADTYLYSFQQLLDRRLAGSRAAELCQGDFAIAGAKEYYAGTGAWEDVGILKTGQFEIVLITARPVAQPEFYVPYYLQASYLVCPSLWESCKQYWDADGNLLSGDCPEAATITSTYCTSLETSVSCGPYTLIAFDPGQQLTLERNFTWYGYMDGLHLGQYQADTISCRIISNYNDILALYAAGELDRITLQSGDIAHYLDNDLLRQTAETYTTKLTFNTDPEALAARGNQVLANATFRKAIALAIDRSRFSAAYTAPGLTGLGLINEAYIADVATGLIYRETEGANTILRQLYGESLTGFDLDAAQNLMRQAFAECLADGSYDGVSSITLQLSVYRDDETYRQIYHYLSRALADAAEGSGFAGKVTLELVVDKNCYAAMAAGQTDMIFSTWGGNALDPFGILYHCYCGENAMEYGFDSSSLTLQTQINGETFSASLLDWARWCAGEQGNAPVSQSGRTLVDFHSFDPESQAAIFAELEFAYLSQFVTTPLYSHGSALLLSEKGDYAVKNQLPLVGFGGIRYYTFAYTDAEWQEPTE